jgi:hypothetical protein
MDLGLLPKAHDIIDNLLDHIVRETWIGHGIRLSLHPVRAFQKRPERLRRCVRLRRDSAKVRTRLAQDRRESLVCSNYMTCPAYVFCDSAAALDSGFVVGISRARICRQNKNASDC